MTKTNPITFLLLSLTPNSSKNLSNYNTSEYIQRCGVFVKLIQYLWRHNTKHNDTQHYDTQGNDTQHIDTQHNDTQHNDSQHNNAQNLVSLC